MRPRRWTVQKRATIYLDPELHRAVPSAQISMHPDDAKQAGLGNGELALLKSRRGEIQLPVWIDGRGKPPRGSAFVPFFDETLLINDLTLEDYCPVSKEPDYKKCAISIEKAPPK